MCYDFENSGKEITNKILKLVDRNEFLFIVTLFRPTQLQSNTPISMNGIFPRASLYQTLS